MSSDDYSVSQPAGGGFEHHAPRQRPRHARTATAKSDPTGGLEPAGDAGKARGDRRVRAARTPKTEVSADVPNSETAADPEVRLDLAPLALPLPADRFLNRELSWLDFNARVLTLAEDPTTPLLERAKFLAIFANNLDEFYMVRVAGLMRRLQTGLPVEGPDGLTPREQLARIGTRTAELMDRHSATFADVEPLLAGEGVHIVRWADLDQPERERLRTYFREQIFPVLTPLAVDPAHPFPYISGLSLNLAVVVRDPDSGPELFARIKVPANVPRFVSVNAAVRSGVDSGARGVCFLPLEELIAAHLGQLFSGMQIIEHHVFRVTRNADVELDDDRDEDLLQALERELARRRFGPPVRLEVASTISSNVLDLLVRELDMDSEHVVRVPGLLCGCHGGQRVYGRRVAPVAHPAA